MQTCEKACEKIDWNLADNSLWLSLLPGETIKELEMEMIKPDEDFSGHVDKHLDMPTSYVEQIDIQSLGKYSGYCFYFKLSILLVI